MVQKVLENRQEWKCLGLLRYANIIICCFSYFFRCSFKSLIALFLPVNIYYLHHSPNSKATIKSLPKLLHIFSFSHTFVVFVCCQPSAEPNRVEHPPKRKMKNVQSHSVTENAFYYYLFYDDVTGYSMPKHQQT